MSVVGAAVVGVHVGARVCVGVAVVGAAVVGVHVGARVCVGVAVPGAAVGAVGTTVPAGMFGVL